MADDEGLVSAMKVAARNNLLIYLLDTESFSTLRKIREAVIAFASKIDIVDMNNIPIKKTIDMLKLSGEDSQRIAKFVLNADLSLDDFRYAGDDELFFRESAQRTPLHRKTLCSRPLRLRRCFTLYLCIMECLYRVFSLILPEPRKWRLSQAMSLAH